MPLGRKMLAMKPLSLHSPFAPRTTRGFALVILALVFLISVFQLTHLAAASSHRDVIDLWRGLSAGSLFLFFCIPAARHTRSGL
jgi:hypothetical protein